MALTDRYSFGPMLVNTTELVFGPNLVPEAGGVTPSITAVSELRPETIITITLDGPITEPLVSVSRGGRDYTNLVVVSPNVIQATSPKSGQIDVNEDLTIEDANGTSAGFAVLSNPPVGFSFVTLNGGAFSDNSLLANSGWPTTAGNQFLLQTNTCDADAVLTNDELLPGDYVRSVWYTDSLNNHQASATDSLTITVSDWTVNAFSFTPNESAAAGATVQSVATIEGIDVDVTMVITNGIGEISNDGGTSWFTSPILSVAGQNRARATVTASLTPGETVQQTVEVNRSSATFTATTAGAALVAPQFAATAYPTLTPEITRGVPVSFSPDVSVLGNPAGQFTDFNNSLPDGLTVDVNTGIVSGTPTTSASITGVVRLENSEGFSDGAFDVTVVDPLPTVYELRLTDLKTSIGGPDIVSQMVNVRVERVSDGGEVYRGTEIITNGVLVITTGISSENVDYRVSFNTATFGDTLGLDNPLVTSQVQA
jgi:hypothetical protein